jgi:uncharacterized RDD family membrane protein YckC
VTAIREREVAIETPEGVRFALPLAGPGTRFLAWLIDAAAIGAAVSFIGKVTPIVAAVSADWVVAISVISFFAISMGYGMTLEWFWRGQTLGKRVLGLRVVDAGGLKLEFSQIAIRNLLRLVDAIPLLYLVGGAAVLLTRDAQRLGDLAANTIVIRHRRHLQFDASRAAPEKFNTLLEYPHLAARLRQKVSPELLAIAYGALARRGELDPGARIEVFRRTAAELRALVIFPEEAIATLTDERYVRAAVDVAMRSAKRI